MLASLVPDQIRAIEFFLVYAIVLLHLNAGEDGWALEWSVLVDSVLRRVIGSEARAEAGRSGLC